MLLPALLLLVCGCASVGSRTWNLEQLHAEDSSYKYTGALMGDLEYLLRQQLFGPSVLFQSGLARKDPSAIEDPSGETLDALIGLMELSPSDRLTRARQIQWFARLAVEDPSALCRERAFLGLAFAAAGLAPIEPQAAPKASERTGELALGTVLSELVRSARAAAERSASATERADFAAACELVRTRKLDLGGARRALEVATSLAANLGFDNPLTPELAVLIEGLERLCAARALSAGLADPEGIAMGAALDATLALYGPQVLPGVLNQLRPDTDAVVVRRLLAGLEVHGLEQNIPGGPGREELFRQQIEALMELVLTRPEGELRVAAMRVLGLHSGAGQSSLREEDWQRWHARWRLTRSGV